MTPLNRVCTKVWTQDLFKRRLAEILQEKKLAKLEFIKNINNINACGAPEGHLVKEK